MAKPSGCCSGLYCSESTCRGGCRGQQSSLWVRRCSRATGRFGSGLQTLPGAAALHIAELRPIQWCCTQKQACPTLLCIDFGESVDRGPGQPWSQPRIGFCATCFGQVCTNSAGGAPWFSSLGNGTDPGNPGGDGMQ